MNSLSNFIWDCYTKSFENADMLYYMSSTISDEEREAIVRDRLNERTYWHTIYNNIVKHLYEHIAINANGQDNKIDEVSFHPKFGWTVSFEDNFAYLGKSSIFEEVKISIGANSYFSGHSIMRGNGLMRIGSYCSLASNIYLNVANQNHPINYPGSIDFLNESRLAEKGLSLKLSYLESQKDNYINIGSDVWLGRNVTVFNQVNIAHGCVIGANSLVTKDCEPYGIYAGSPVRLLRYRFNDSLIQELLEVKWWEWPKEKILLNTAFFNTDLSAFSGSIYDLINYN